MNGSPASIGGGGEGASLGRGDGFSFEDVEIRGALAEGDELKMALDPVKNFVVELRGDFLRPVFTAVIEAVQSGKNDANGILRAGEDFGARWIFEGEKNFGEFGAVAFRDFGLPEFDGATARA